jgi:hypothetical protein
MRKVLAVCMVVFTVFAATFATITLLTSTATPVAAAVGGGCICPMIYAPVLCSNGRTYTNGCFASCAHATGCVLIGGPIAVQ